MRKPLTSVELAEEDIKEMNNILVERMLLLAKQETEKGNNPTVGILKVTEPTNKWEYCDLNSHILYFSVDSKPRTSSGLSTPLTQVTETSSS